MGFLREDAPLDELPLLVDFEAKSIAKKFPLAKARMEQLYVLCTSDFLAAYVLYAVSMGCEATVTCVRLSTAGITSPIGACSCCAFIEHSALLMKWPATENNSFQSTRVLLSRITFSLP
jgi:hypothetical protein